MAPSKNFLQRLTGGDRRSIGQSDDVAALVRKRPSLFRELVRGMRSEDPLIRMRSADAAEKVSRAQPELLGPHKGELLRLLDSADEQELRWHLAQMVPRLELTKRERLLAASTLRKYLRDSSFGSDRSVRPTSSIVSTFALQALAELAEKEQSLRLDVIRLLRESLKTGTAAMKARSRKILKQMEKRRGRELAEKPIPRDSHRASAATNTSE
ncbi:MAG TPA: hypothetical protein VFO39_14155 [Candidatus Sulfotelmatobacter sp.]|nr:hypothetical protein [Candidatus Sulfotelmatobacter sp.]